ncbi:MAG: GntR family transcriptional regulator [Micrococcus sp.]|nr:GntR family transcriptional regulator [Micrococcus sp.]
MRFTVDPGLTTPVYEQVVEQIVQGVRSGSLVPGEKLPTVRHLAADLGVAVNTVAKAYRHLEEQGHVETRGRSGTLVRGELAPHLPSRAAAERYAQTARQAGLDLEQAIGLLRRSW